MKRQSLKVLQKKVAAALEDDLIHRARVRALEVMRPAHEMAVAYAPHLAERLREVKERSIGGLKELLPAAMKSLSENGFRVYVAPDAPSAVRHVLGLLGPNCRTVVKSKSNTVKEIGLVRQLESRGIEVVETDLGDRIVQLSGVRPGHPLAPAIQVPRERVAELFGCDSESTSIEGIVARARGNLRQTFLRADMGITGANAIVAREGLVTLVENEGNIRALSSLVPVHVVIAGINKIVPTLGDAITVVRAASTYGAGQDVGTYVSIIGSPGRTPAGVDREVHVVLLDNGRTEAIEHGFGEALNCINCGGCLLFCPIYAELGDAYGSEYLGGTGTVFAELLEGPGKGVEAGLDLCLTCRACIEHCPAKIDIPGLILRMRSLVTSRDGLPVLDEIVLKGVLRRKHVMRLLVRLARLLRPLLFSESPVRPGIHPRVSVGVPKERLLPRLESGYGEKRLPQAPSGRMRMGSRNGVVLFPGCLAELGLPNVTRASVEVIRGLGYSVELFPELGCCGAPAYMKGERRVARKLASSLVERLCRFPDTQLVTPCPTCASTIKHFYPEILEGTPFEREAASLAKNTFDVTQFIAGSIERLSRQFGELRRAAPVFQEEGFPARGSVSGKAVTYHDPCHLKRWLCISVEPREIIRAVPGVNLVEMRGCDECCGFAGLFGIKYYGLSSRIGAGKARAILESGADEVLSACPGCVIQLSDALEKAGSPIPARHVVELIHESLEGRSLPTGMIIGTTVPDAGVFPERPECPQLTGLRRWPSDPGDIPKQTELAKPLREEPAESISVRGDLLEMCRKQLEAKGCVVRVVKAGATERREEAQALASAIIGLIDEHVEQAFENRGVLVKAIDPLSSGIGELALDLEGLSALRMETLEIEQLARIGSEVSGLLEGVNVSVSGFDAVVAETGSIVIGDDCSNLTVVTALPRLHIAVGRESQVVQTLEEGIDVAMRSRRAKPSRISVISGPSRTRDIECQLVKGMHGPSVVAVVLLPSRGDG